MAIYTAEQLKLLQTKSLAMAKYFVSFCNEHELLCYFCGGGCIGSLRHKGFIPWDDDLDFFMPREDYEKLAILWTKYADINRYELSKSDVNMIDRNLFITIRDNQTTLIKPYQQDLDISHGLALDILPLDGYPNSGLKRKMQCFWAIIYSLYCSQTIPTNHGKVMRFGATIMLMIIPNKKWRYSIWKYAEKKMIQYPISSSEYITELCSGPQYMKKKYPKNIFDKSVFVDFEDTKMPIPIGADKYLQEAFGDYMKLPPKNKQVAHHDFIFMDLENSYKKYNGTYYGNQKVTYKKR